MKNLPLSVKILIGILLIVIPFSCVKSVYEKFTGFYNSCIEYKTNYTQLEQSQVTSFDNYYLAFQQKSNITSLNKETFIEVTKIIMSNRKDGKNLSWKWNTENQQIPYEEFTSFYKDLSNFIAEQYALNSKIELQKQEVIKRHNVLINTFPGIIYNYFIKIKPLIYTEGFISSETKKLFTNYETNN